MDSEQIVKLRERLLQCAVCMDEYRDPRLLPCHHTMCFECIESVLQSSSSSGRSFKCPQCRKDVNVPKVGTGELPINFYIISLQDELGIKGYTGTCDICEHHGISAQFRCIDCDIDVCGFCIHAHRLKTHIEPPKILRIESGSSNISVHACTIHENESCQLFCRTCNQAICVTCFCSNHTRHKTVPISVQLQETTKYLQNELDRLLSEKRNALTAGEEMDNLKQKVIDSHEQSIGCLTVAADEACRLIIERTKTLEAVIRSSAKTQQEEIEVAIRDYKSYIKLIEKGVCFLQDLQTSDICLEAVDAYKEFGLRLNAAKKKYASKRFNLQMCKFSLSPFSSTKVFSINLFDKYFYHFGKLGTFSKNKYSVNIDHKTMKPVKRSQDITNHFTKSRSRMIVKIFLVLFLFYIILYAVDFAEIWSWLYITVSTLFVQMWLDTSIFSRYSLFG